MIDSHIRTGEFPRLEGSPSCAIVFTGGALPFILGADALWILEQTEIFCLGAGVAVSWLDMSRSLGCFAAKHPTRRSSGVISANASGTPALYPGHRVCNRTLKRLLHLAPARLPLPLRLLP